MGEFADGLKVLDECCGGGKDNVISLATIAIEGSEGEAPCPAVRDVDAFYEDGVFYLTTSAQSNKVLQITRNRNVAFSVYLEGICGNGTVVNLGWVLRPENEAIRGKLRGAFADWYDAANDEDDQNCVILAISVTRIAVFRDHGAIQGVWSK